MSCCKEWSRCSTDYLFRDRVGRGYGLGEPRLTNDIDIVVGVENRHIAGLLCTMRYFTPLTRCC
jgi:hypothetical protein